MNTIKDFLVYLCDATAVIIIGGLVTTVAGFLVAYRQNPPPRLLKRLAIASAIGGVLAICGGVWSGYQQSRNDRELLSKTDQITQLTKRNADYVIGGDSYCYFIFCTWPNRASWLLCHNGDYPLYDLEIRILDIIKRDKLAKERPGYITANHNREAETIQPYGTLIPHDNRSLFKEDSFETDEMKLYRITFFARNGSWYENVCFIKKNGKWEHAWYLSLRSSITHRFLPEGAKTREGRSEGFPEDFLQALRK